MSRIQDEIEQAQDRKQQLSEEIEKYTGILKDLITRRDKEEYALLAMLRTLEPDQLQLPPPSKKRKERVVQFPHLTRDVYEVFDRSEDPITADYISLQTNIGMKSIIKCLYKLEADGLIGKTLSSDGSLTYIATSKKRANERANTINKVWPKADSNTLSQPPENIN
jgi:hypothetical protein